MNTVAGTITSPAALNVLIPAPCDANPNWFPDRIPTQPVRSIGFAFVPEPIAGKHGKTLFLIVTPFIPDPPPFRNRLMSTLAAGPLKMLSSITTSCGTVLLVPMRTTSATFL